MFSNSTKYAIRAVVFLCEHREEQRKYKVDEMGEYLGIPKPFLSKILQQLAKNYIISSTKGRAGGFYLNDANLEKTLLDVMICIEGSNVFDECILGLKKCNDENPCYMHQYYKGFKKKINKVISEVKLADLYEFDISGKTS